MTGNQNARVFLSLALALTSRLGLSFEWNALTGHDGLGDLSNEGNGLARAYQELIDENFPL
jgi:hypothetical protein